VWKIRLCPNCDGSTRAAVNPTTSTIYASNYRSHTVSVIDGPSKSVVATVAVGSNPLGLAVDSARDRIYVDEQFSNAVTVIKG
jgi:YVTN family beta-propeller protein